MPQKPAWNKVTFRSSKTNPKFRNKHEFIQNELGALWAAKLGVQSLKLECTKEEADYVTRPSDAMFIQEEITKSMAHIKVFVDGFASIGGDSMAATYAHPSSQIYAVQRIKTREEENRFERLVKNMKAFHRAAHRAAGGHQGEVVCVPEDIGTFLRNSKERKVNISVLYLDPPWSLDEPGVISPMVDIHKFLTNNVYNHLPRGHLIPLICLKLPHEVKDLDEWLPKKLRYQLVKTLFIRKKYYVYFLMPSGKMKQM
jgi:hypothetical protein